MIDILDIPAIRRMARPLSVETYEKLCADDAFHKEFIRGFMLKDQSVEPRHSRLINRLRHLVEANPSGVDTHCRVSKALKLRDSVPRPDLAVVEGTAEMQQAIQANAVRHIIEVVTHHHVNLEYVKAAIYAEAKVAEYWIVLANKEAVEVLTEPAGSEYMHQRTYRRGETISGTAVAALRIELDALFGEKAEEAIDEDKDQPPTPEEEARFAAMRREAAAD